MRTIRVGVEVSHSAGALLTAERRSLDDLGRVLDCGSHLYRPDRYAFETTLVGR